MSFNFSLSLCNPRKTPITSETVVTLVPNSISDYILISPEGAAGTVYDFELLFNSTRILFEENVVTGNTPFHFRPLLYFAVYIPTLRSVPCTIRLHEKSGGTVLSHIDKTFTVAVPDTPSLYPTLTNFTVTKQPSLPSPLNGLYIQGVTKIKGSAAVSSPRLTAPDGTDRGAASYTTLTRLSVGEASAVGNPSSPLLLRNSGANTVSYSVEDARGFVTTVTDTVTVTPYSPPRLLPAVGREKILAYRTNGNGVETSDGNMLYLTFRREYTALEGNSVAVTAQVMEEGGEFTSPVTLTMSGDTFVGTVPDLLLSGKAHTLRLTVTDTVSGDREALIKIPAVEIPLHLAEGGKTMAVGGLADSSNENQLDIYWRLNPIGGILPTPIVSGVTLSSGDTFTLSRESSHTLYLVTVTGGLPLLCVRVGNTVYGSANFTNLSVAVTVIFTLDGTSGAVTTMNTSPARRYSVTSITGLI